MLGEHDRDIEFAQQRDEFRHEEAVMPHFHDVTQPQPVLFLGQQLEERAEIGCVEFLGGCELPEQGAEAIAELGDAGIQEPLDGTPRLRTARAGWCRSATP